MITEITHQMLLAQPTLKLNSNTVCIGPSVKTNRRSLGNRRNSFSKTLAISHMLTLLSRKLVPRILPDSPGTNPYPHHLLPSYQQLCWLGSTALPTRQKPNPATPIPLSILMVGTDTYAIQLLLDSWEPLLQFIQCMTRVPSCCLTKVMVIQKVCTP